MADPMTPRQIAEALKQRPYLNIFKAFGVEHGSSEVEFRGQVDYIIDPTIQKRVYALSGAVPVSTHLRIPSDRTRDIRLTGRFMYLHVKLEAGQHFVCHVDLVARYSPPIASPRLNREVISLQSPSNMLERMVRVSVSNMYRNYEEGAAAKGELRVQVPCPVFFPGWHVLALDLLKLTADYSRDGLRYDHVRAVTVCASLSIRNIFTSDYRYPILGMPPEMALSMKPEIASEVTLRWMPEEPIDVSLHPPHPASTTRKMTGPQTSTGPRLPHRLQALLESDRGLQLTPARDLVGGRGGATQSRSRSPPGGSGEPGYSSRTFGPGYSYGEAGVTPGAAPHQEPSDLDILEESAVTVLAEGPGTPPRAGTGTVAAAASPRQGTTAPQGAGQGKASLQSSGTAARLDGTRMIPPPPLCARISRIDPLPSAPSAQLRFINGYTGDSSPSSRRLLVAEPGFDAGPEHTRRQLVFASNHLIVAMDAPSHKRVPGTLPFQRFFRGHSARITTLALSGDARVLASAEETTHLGLPAIRVWDFTDGRLLAILPLREADRPVQVTSIDLSADGSRLVALGSSNVDEAVLAVWDLNPVLLAARGDAAAPKASDAAVNPPAPRLLARQVLDCDARCVRLFPPVGGPAGDEEMVVCGKNCLRVHRLHKGSDLRGMSVTLAPRDDPRLSELAKAALIPNTFTAVAFDESEPDPSIGMSAYVASVTGHVFKIDVARRKLLSIYHLHNGSINAIDVRGGHCVTGGDDRSVRVWPLDFNDFLLEAEHEGAVSDLAFSRDALTAAVGTEDGCIGQLSVTARDYEMTLRAHTGPIVDTAVAEDLSRAVTVSADGTIRSWLLPGLVQDGEFVADAEDTPVSVDLCRIDLDDLRGPDSTLLTPLPPPPGSAGPTGIQNPPPAPGSWAAAVGFSSGIVRVFELGKNLLLTETRQHRAPVTTVRFTPGARWMFTADSQGQICVYQPHRGFLPLKYLNAGISAASGPGAGGAVQSLASVGGGAAGARFPLAVSRDGSLLACVLSDRDGKPCLVLFALAGAALRALFKVDLSSPLTATPPPGTPTPPGPAPAPAPRTAPVHGVSFNGLGTEILLARSDGALERYDAFTGALLARGLLPGHHLGFSSMALDLWDRLVVTAGARGDLRLWEARSLAKPTLLSVATDGPSSLSLLLDPHGARPLANHLMIGASDGSLQIWGLGDDAMRGVEPIRSAWAANRAVAVEADIWPPGAAVVLAEPTGASGGHAAALSAAASAAEAQFGVQPSLASLYGGSVLESGAAAWCERRGSLAYTSGRLLVVEELYRNPLLTASLPSPRVQRFIHCSDDIVALAWAKDGSILLAGLAGGDVQVWTSPGPQDTWSRAATLSRHRLPTEALALSDDATLVASASASEVAIWDLVTGTAVAVLTHRTHPRQIQAIRGLAFVDALSGPTAGVSIVTWGAYGATLWVLGSDYRLEAHPLWSYPIAVAKGLVTPAVEAGDPYASLDERSVHVAIREALVDPRGGHVRLLTDSGAEAKILLPGPSTGAEPRIASLQQHSAASYPSLHPVPQRGLLEALATQGLFDTAPRRAATWGALRGRRAVYTCSDGSAHLADLDWAEAERIAAEEGRSGLANESSEEDAGQGEPGSSGAGAGAAAAPAGVGHVAVVSPLASRIQGLSGSLLTSVSGGSLFVARDDAGNCSTWVWRPGFGAAPIMDVASAASLDTEADPVVASDVDSASSVVGLGLASGLLAGISLEAKVTTVDWEVQSHRRGARIIAIHSMQWGADDPNPTPEPEPEEAATAPAPDAGEENDDAASDSSSVRQVRVTAAAAAAAAAAKRRPTAKRYFVSVDDSGLMVFTKPLKGHKWGQVDVGKSVKAAHFASLGPKGSLALLHTSAPEAPPQPGAAAGTRGGPDPMLSPRAAAGRRECLELWRLAWDDEHEEPKAVAVAVFDLPEGTVIASAAVVAGRTVRVAFHDASLGATVYWAVARAPRASYGLAALSSGGAGGAGDASPGGFSVFSAMTQQSADSIPAITLLQTQGTEITAVGILSRESNPGAPSTGPVLVLGHADGTVLCIDEASIGRLAREQGELAQVTLPPPGAACSVGGRVDAVMVVADAGAGGGAVVAVAAGKGLGVLHYMHGQT